MNKTLIDIVEVYVVGTNTQDVHKIIGEELVTLPKNCVTGQYCIS